MLPAPPPARRNFSACPLARGVLAPPAHRGHCDQYRSAHRASVRLPLRLGAGLYGEFIFKKVWWMVEAYKLPV